MRSNKKTMNLCLQKLHFWLYHCKKASVFRYRQTGLLIVQSHQGKREMVTVVFNLQCFGVKNLTGTNWAMEVRQYCSLVWIPDYPKGREP